MALFGGCLLFSFILLFLTSYSKEWYYLLYGFVQGICATLIFVQFELDFTKEESKLFLIIILLSLCIIFVFFTVLLGDKAVIMCSALVGAIITAHNGGLLLHKFDGIQEIRNKNTN